MNFHLSLHTDPVEAAYPADPIVVEPSASIADVFALLKAHKAGKVLVCRDGVLQGIFTERDALKLMAAGADLAAPVEQVMVERPVTVRAGDTVAKAVRMMAEGGYRRLPIVDDQGHPTGVAGVEGIVHFIVEHFPKTVYNLPPQPKTVMHQREGA